MRNDRNEPDLPSSDRADRFEGAIDASKARERIGDAKPEVEHAASGAGSNTRRVDDLDSSLRDGASDERGEVL